MVLSALPLSLPFSFLFYLISHLKTNFNWSAMFAFEEKIP